MIAPFAFDRAWSFPVAPEELWDVLNETDAYPRWWSWLRTFDGDGLVVGGATECVVRGPFPYALNFTVNVEEIEPCALVRTHVTGDLHGPARLELTGTESGTTARLAWEVDLRAPLLRPMARWARPLMEWGHTWVVDNGVRRFRRQALGID